MSGKNEIREKLSRLPTGPGVYLMKDAEGRILYVGKAKNLVSRVRSYFGSSVDRPKTAVLVSKIADFDYIVTDNEVEALLLESNLIKEHTPRYNINLKDDKRYPYLKVTVKEAFPRAFVTRRYVNDGSRYFGPYTDAGALRTTMDSLRKIFPLRHCNHDLPEKRGARECLNYHLGKCSAPCHGHISRDDYRAMIDEVLLFMEGKTADIEKRLEHKMREAAAELRFEQAARYRDQLEAVQRINQRQKTDLVGGADQDVLAVSVDGGDACGVLLKVRDGKLLGREHHYLKLAPGSAVSEVMEAFIGQKYLTEREYPGELLLNSGIDDIDLYEEVLGLEAGHRVRVRVPERGAKAGMVGLAEKNSHLLLEELVMRKNQARQRVPQALVGLQKAFSLEAIPRLMVCFDVSTIQGSSAVAAMSAFRNGEPHKGSYRKFRIKGVVGQDDFAMMKEAVGRYFSRVAKGDFDLPGLVVIDGGKGQLSAAVEAIGEAGIEKLPPIIGLAKREEEIFMPGKSEPFVLSRRNESLKMLQRLRDEAHRFAVTYHRNVRSRNTLISRLEEVPGIGRMRANAIKKAAGSAAAAGRMKPDELAAKSGIPEDLAREVISHLNGKTES